jgi:four helix bundle protein
MGTQSHKKLHVWQRAMALATRVYLESNENPVAKDWALRDQMRRAAVSIASNIAEGNGRGTDRDACRFFFIAKASAAELATHVQIAANVEFMDPGHAAAIEQECEELAAMLFALIKSRMREPGPGPWRLEPGA